MIDQAGDPPARTVAEVGHDRKPEDLFWAEQDFMSDGIIVSHDLLDELTWIQSHNRGPQQIGFRRDPAASGFDHGNHRVTAQAHGLGNLDLGQASVETALLQPCPSSLAQAFYFSTAAMLRMNIHAHLPSAEPASRHNEVV